jgi:hypothetical protein
MVTCFIFIQNPVSKGIEASGEMTLLMVTILDKKYPSNHFPELFYLV